VVFKTASEMAVSIETLKSIKFFVGLDSSDLDLIKSSIVEKRVGKGEILLMEEEWSHYLYFVVSGMVKVYKSSASGKEQILNIACPGDALNYVAVFGNRPSVASMSTMTPVHLYAISNEDMQFILHRSPSLCINIIKYLANRVCRDSHLVTDLSSSLVLTRLAKLLIGKYAGIETPVELLNQGDMAGIIGTRREIVNRSLRAMEKRGAIKVVHQRVVVVDPEMLAEMAEDYEDTMPAYLRTN